MKTMQESTHAGRWRTFAFRDLLLTMVVMVISLTGGVRGVMASESRGAPSQHGWGCAACSQLGGTVWKDLNRDGVFGAGEPGVANVRVYLSRADYPGGSFRTTYTDARGFYMFSQLPSGYYAVTVDTHGAPVTTFFNPLPAVYLNGQQISWANFGLATDVYAAPPMASAPSFPVGAGFLLPGDGATNGGNGGGNAPGIPLSPEDADAFGDLRAFPPSGGN